MKSNDWDALAHRFAHPTMDDEQLRHRRNGHRRTVAHRPSARTLLVLALADLGAIALVWQLTWQHPSPLGVLAAMVMVLAGVWEVLR